jgi:hypothetical protein
MKLTNTQARKYQKIEVEVKRFIQRHKKIDHSRILNEIDVDYDTLVKILGKLKNQGQLK